MHREKLIFPAELVECTVQHHFRKYSRSSGIIYLVVLLSFTGALIASFFIPVNVSVNARGMLVPEGGRSDVRAPVPGRVKAVFAADNEHVEKGAVLFSIRSDILEQEAAYLRQRRVETIGKLSDLRWLVKLCGNADAHVPAPPASLASEVYAGQYELFRQRLEEAFAQLANKTAIYERKKYLFGSGVIARAEFEACRYELDAARGKVRRAYREQGSRWQEELDRLDRELRQLDAEKERSDREQEVYTVRAPVDGSLQGMDGLRPGVFVNAGQKVAELSPDSGLIAKIAVPPADIGLLREGMRVRFSVDAFNSNEWGMAGGTVLEIPDDVVAGAENHPVFGVRCSLEGTVLRLRSGFPGKLKKGMTLTARFTVARRTLFQLLYDRADDWLDPNGAN